MGHTKGHVRIVRWDAGEDEAFVWFGGSTPEVTDGIFAAVMPFRNEADANEFVRRWNLIESQGGQRP